MKSYNSEVLFVFLGIFSLAFIQLIEIEILKLFYISITEIIILFISLFIFFKNFNFKKYKNIIFINIQDKLLFLLISIVFLHLIIFGNLNNLILFLKLIFVVFVYFVFKIISYKNEILKTIIFSFIILSLFSSFIINLSYFFYLIDININKILNYEFWVVHEHYNPAYGLNTIHFKGLFKFYNMQAYIIIPGLFFLYYKFLENKKYINLIFVLFILLAIFLIKTKVIVLIIPILIFFTFLKFNNYFKKKLLLSISLLYFIFLVIVYAIVTNFTLLIFDYNQMDNNLFAFYLTDYTLLEFNDFKIHGTLFYKLKVIGYRYLLDSSTLLYFKNFFEFANYNEFPNLFDNNKINTLTPHFELMNLYVNYKIFGFFTILFFYIKFIYTYFKKILIFEKNQLFLIFGSIIILMLIESINTDITFFYFMWILYAVLYSIIDKKIK